MDSSTIPTSMVDYNHISHAKNNFRGVNDLHDSHETYLNADGDSFDSYINRYGKECVEKTDLLRVIKEWTVSVDSREPQLFWLHGAAGTGKTTISHSVVKFLKNNESFGACIFFRSSNESPGNITQFLLAIARQWTADVPKSMAQIETALHEKPDIWTRDIGEQFHRLLIQPLSGTRMENPVRETNTRIIVIDGIDKFYGEDDEVLMTQLMLRLSRLRRLRLFVTSRNGMPTGLVSKLPVLKRPIITRELFLCPSKHEMTLFVGHMLLFIRQKHKLPENWPGDRIEEAIADPPHQSFVLAKNACKALERSGSLARSSSSKILNYLNGEFKSVEVYMGDLPTEPFFDPISDNMEFEAKESDGSSDEDQSEIESVFSAESMSSWQSSQPEIASAAISELVSLFLEDHELVELYSKAITKVGPERFRRNFGRILKRYGQGLFVEASNQIQREAAHFVRSSARRAAIEVHLRVAKIKEVSIKEQTDFSSIGCDFPGNDLIGLDDLRQSVSDDGLSSESDLEFALSEPYSLATREDVKEFMRTGNSYLNLRTEFREWIEGKGVHVYGDESKNTEGYTSEAHRDEANDDSGILEVRPEKAPTSMTQTQPWSNYKQTAWTTYTTRCVNWLRSLSRPRLRHGYRRIEWRCDCGIDLYADFDCADRKQLDELEFSLQNALQASEKRIARPETETSKSWVAQRVTGNFPNSVNARQKVETFDLPEQEATQYQLTDEAGLSAQIPDSQRQHLHEVPRQQASNPAQLPQLSHITPSTTVAYHQKSTPPASNNVVKGSSSSSTEEGERIATSAGNLSHITEGRARFLALCVNTGTIYKTLAELDTSSIKSDAVAFSLLRDQYHKTRGIRSRFNFLIEPITIEFIQFTLWNLRGGFISVCDRPNCIPPNDCHEYEFRRPPKRHPPMPPEIFIHYLNHGDGDLNPIRNDWLPRLPKRKEKRVIDCDEACFGWGMHVIEGPNRAVIFSIMMITIFASALTAILWSTLRSDIQGGAGLGALMVALPPAILTAFLFRLGGI